MLEEIKRKFRKTELYPLYCKMRGWNPDTAVNINKNQVWAFNAGNTFTGNPKWLFIYVNKYRKDIDAYWICDSTETTEYIRSLGYKAYMFNESEGIEYQQKTGVFVVEQVKEHIPINMINVKLLNLYHGVGCKSVEKKVNYGFLLERIAKKYIVYNEFYQKNMLFLVTSPLMEKHFIEQCGLNEQNIIRAGYPRCIYQRYYEKIATFNHDILAEKGLPEDTKIAAYVPTYRDNPDYDFWENAVPDFSRLVQKLEYLKMLLIIKVHPQMINNVHYQYLLSIYKDSPYILFWDNTKDFYEIFDKIDVGIIDYSSIYYDMMAGGVKYFIRYFFDYAQGDTLRDMVFDLKEMTCGKLCENFEEFLDALGNYDQEPLSEQEKIDHLFWQYSDKDSMEKIIEETLKFKPNTQLNLPTLYTFDIFDTLISRKVLDPKGIFFYVKEKIEKSAVAFPAYLKEKYPLIRQKCESNVREYYAKTLEVRKSDWREISFAEIFDRMAEMYELSSEQVQLLMEWELEAEYDNCIPRDKEIGLIEKLINSGEQVALISDMYLPEEFIRKMLKKVCPLLEQVPLFLSSTYGVQKTTKKLFLEVYKSFDVYNFKAWIHYGDNALADGTRPRELGIRAVKHVIPTFDEYEQQMVSRLGTYDAYLVAALMARFRMQNMNDADQFVYGYVSLYFVPYIEWAVYDAVKRKIDCLYFISRDGYHLKQIADVIVKEKQLPLKTKYIYGSRRAWRIPSFIEKIDDGFFSPFGNFGHVNSYDNLLKALMLNDEQFSKIFPGLEYVRTIDFINASLRTTIIKTVEASKEYREHLLKYASERRKIVEDYIRQEIDFTEKFAFVEYWGRGYTQDCFARLLQHAIGEEIDVPYYYARSIYPTQGHYVRYNFTTNNRSLIFTEAIFANIPYKSIAAYKYDESGKIVPEIEPIECNMEIHRALDKCLVLFTKDYLKLPLLDSKRLQQDLYDFSLDYFHEHQEDDIFTKCLAVLVDSVTMYGEKQEFAPAITEETLSRIAEGEKIGALTRSVPMSLKRSSKEMAERFIYQTEILPQKQKEKARLELMEKAEKKEQEKADENAIYSLKKLKRDAKKLQQLYEQYAECNPVERKILFVNGVINQDFDYAWSLQKETEKLGYQSEELHLCAPYASFIPAIASAEFIVLSNVYNLFSMLKLRRETTVIYAGIRAFPFLKKKLYNFSDDMSENQKKLESYKAANHIDWMTLPGKALKEDFCKARFLVPEKTLMYGSLVTDVLFDEEFKKNALKSLYDYFPTAKDKKIILYMPSHRYKKNATNVPEVLDLQVLKDNLEKDYVFIMHNNAGDQTKAYHMSSKYQAFAMEMTGKMTIHQLMVVADVIVGDYRGEFFEAALMRKPMYSTAYDADIFLQEKELLVPLEECQFMPLVRDAYDLVNELQKISSYHFEKIDSFCNNYLEACDGKTGNRLINMVFKSSES